jgi:hypothetical protein
MNQIESKNNRTISMLQSDAKEAKYNNDNNKLLENINKRLFLLNSRVLDESLEQKIKKIYEKNYVKEKNSEPSWGYIVTDDMSIGFSLGFMVGSALTAVFLCRK